MQTDGRSYTTGDIVEFALLAALFVPCTLCASCGVALALSGPQSPRAVIYRPVLVGMTCFVVYYLGKIFPKLKKKLSKHSSNESGSSNDSQIFSPGVADIDYVFRIVMAYKPKGLRE